MCGARERRHIFLFDKALFIAKKKSDGTLLIKVFIEVNDEYTVIKPKSLFISAIFFRESNPELRWKGTSSRIHHIPAKSFALSEPWQSHCNMCLVTAGLTSASVSGLLAAII